MKPRQIIAIILTILVMAFIYYNSSQDSVASSQASDFVMNWLWDHGIYLSAYAVRKLAHFCEFALLGFLLVFALGGKVFLALLVGVLYAGTDEFHQRFVSGRVGQLLDLVIDGAGVFCGMVLAGILLLIGKLLFHKNR
ncbi:MAG: VanZ family protein [Eubacteriales bacterium]|nr:VanZ family protein [Eubacteriales bacterium]